MLGFNESWREPEHENNSLFYSGEDEAAKEVEVETEEANTYKPSMVYVNPNHVAPFEALHFAESLATSGLVWLDI
jgi:hypothetical protein